MHELFTHDKTRNKGKFKYYGRSIFKYLAGAKTSKMLCGPGEKKKRRFKATTILQQKAWLAKKKELEALLMEDDEYEEDYDEE